MDRTEIGGMLIQLSELLILRGNSFLKVMLPLNICFP